MKKYSLLFIVLFKSFLIFGQSSNANEPQIKSDLPTILPPSPSVASLMRFEEVPVNNYTGIPDVSIPLFSTPSLSKDISLDISLKYHPSAVAADERASDVGLGWSLFAGGTISRTVRGMPDDILEIGDTPRIGLYQQSSDNVNYKNKYYECFNYIQNYFEGNADDIPTNGFDLMDSYLWNAQVAGTFDTEHDLWQFNFMGKSGRFYIKKNQNNQLEIVPLDDYRLKIINVYGNSTNPYTPTAFTVYDETGNSYYFDVVETTTSSHFSNHQPAISREENDINTTNPYSYKSAFHLSKIYNAQGRLLMDFTYRTEVMKERVTVGGTTFYVQDYDANYSHGVPPLQDFYLDALDVNPCMSGVQDFNPYPYYSTSSTETEISTKKLQNISVVGVASVDFIYTKGREDTNYRNHDDCYIFKGIEVHNSKGLGIKKITIGQDYSQTLFKRMILKRVLFQNFVDTKEQVYELFYRQNLNPYGTTAEYIAKDYWGYMKVRNPLDLGQKNRNPDPVYCTSDTLQKMILPSGGCIIYEFGPNTYSFIGSTALTDAAFDANPDNWEDNSVGFTFTTSAFNHDSFVDCSSGNACDFTIQDTQNLVFTANIQTTTGQGEYHIKLWNVTNPTAEIGGRMIELNQNEPVTFSLANVPPGTYKISMSTTNGASSENEFVSAQIYTYYKNRNSNQFHFLYGGGNRINRIGYFKDSAVPQTYYQDFNLLQPEKEKNYRYGLFDDAVKSSGSLVFNVPQFDYARYKKECPHCENTPVFTSAATTSAVTWKNDDHFGWFYNVTTSFNNLNPVKTQGAEVGYQNVSVYETNNGRTDYEYTSPVTVPENIGTLNLSPPFLPTENYDYKRGLLTKQTIYDQANRKINQIVFGYENVNYIESTGIKTYYPLYDFVNIYHHKHYLDYKNYIESCGQNSSFLHCNNLALTTGHGGNIGTNAAECDCFCYFGRPRDFMSAKIIKEAYGWAKLTSKSTIDYFYDSSNNARTVQTDETFTYNPANKKIDEHTLSNSLGEITKTKYFYLQTVDNQTSQNNIAQLEKVEVSKNDELLSSKHISYATNWEGNQSYLPATIETAKSTENLETRVRFTNYDPYGHPLEVQQENGTFISYIWGYNNSQPIAKIENARYADIGANLIQDAQNESNAPTATAASLETKLKVIRAALPAAMVTTYTYLPLVGVATVTDPKGYTTTYSYDNFGNLSAVYDAAGNQISSNEYHYRTQN